MYPVPHEVPLSIISTPSSCLPCVTLHPHIATWPQEESTGRVQVLDGATACPPEDSKGLDDMGPRSYQARCAVLRCAALRCAVLCCAVLRCAVLRHAVLSTVMTALQPWNRW